VENPHTLYARLRRECPIARVAETGVHLVATWDLIEEALGRQRDFSANLTGVLIRGEDGEPRVFELPDAAGTRVIATADDPEHAVHRTIVRPQLSTARIAGLEGTVRSWARAAIAEWVSANGGDFVPLAERIPARVVAKVLGLPDEDVARHRTWAMVGGDMLAGDMSLGSMTALATETLGMVEYLGAHLEKARSALREDADAPMLHALAQSVEGGEITVDEAVGIAAVMFGAGGESTAALIGSVVRRLAENPEIFDALRHDSTVIPNFVEEVARLEPPFKFHYRAVRRDCELGSVSLVTGDRLMLLWASANRDPARIENPEALRLDRPYPRDHISFGRGVHFCVGAPLARLEARIVCEELLDRTKGLALSGEEAPVYVPSIFVRRLERLPLVVVD
jgi:cytochrome P450